MTGLKLLRTKVEKQQQPCGRMCAYCDEVLGLASAIGVGCVLFAGSCDMHES